MPETRRGTVRAGGGRAGGLDPQPLWYKDAVVYEVHVRAFADSNGDGIGDFPGLTGRLDYLQSLGVTALWLLPFYPSPLRDDGYDIADYTGIHPAYGTMRDFRVFLREAHRRGLRVITELVLNHTSDRHPWFQRARRARPGSRWRDFYVWSDTPDRYKDARIIFRDFEPSNWTLDPVAGAYYWHRFYTHQPDLNFDSAAVRRAMFDVVDFWMAQGVDGMRLDAVPYLVEREGTGCENLPETHAVLKALRRHVDERFANRMLLAEANQWPEEASAYFGAGDECHMAFHFPLMPRLFMALYMEDRFPIVEIMSQTPAIPDSSQWALFLRNHDELTLEMVTDEDRDYMYRVYAQDPHARLNLGIRRRLAPLLGNHRRRIELMKGLLFSIPGTPVLYYGDEIGMGDNVYLGDRNGVRTPMQWSADRNAGFSRANPQSLYLPVTIDPEYHYETVNVEAQHNNPYSLLWWMRRLIALRARHHAFGRGTLEFLQPENRKVLTFLRKHEDEQILVVANLSRFVQYVELLLPEHRGMVPVELFGRTEFPPIGDLPYFLTLGPHAFYWFALEPARPKAQAAASPDGQAADLPVVALPGGWARALDGRGRGAPERERAALEQVLGDYVRGRRWFGGKARRVRSVQIQDAISLPPSFGDTRILLLQVSYAEGDPEEYVLPLAFAAGERAARVRADLAPAVVARVRTDEAEDGVLYDPVWDREFAAALLDAIGRRRRLRGAGGELLAAPTQAFRRTLGAGDGAPDPTVLKAEQSNTSIVYGDRAILKLFRRPGAGENPDLEIGRFLTERAAFPHVPQVAGAIEYRPVRGAPLTLGILQSYVRNEGDAWRYTLDVLRDYFDRLATHPAALDDPALRAPEPLLDVAARGLPPAAPALIGEYLHAAGLLGRRTAELHTALSLDTRDPAFAPETITPIDQRALYQSMRALARQALLALRRGLRLVPEEARGDAERVLALEPELLRRLRALLDRKLTAQRIRTHGDYHLGQVLYTGKDFVIIDFEGEPARPLSERRRKRPAFRDVAGMLRSFDYAALGACAAHLERGGVPGDPAGRSAAEAGARLWSRWVSAAFMRGYLDAAGKAVFVPRGREEAQVLLDAHLIEKAVYELGYELNNRPAWVWIPLRGILDLAGSDARSG